MTIVTSTSNPFLQSPRGPQKKPAGPQHKPQQPLFGREGPAHDTYTPKDEHGNDLTNAKGEKITREYRVNGLLPTNERLPVKTGGLGEVCFTITKAMAKFGTPKYLEGKVPQRDLRVVVPYLLTNRVQDDKFKVLLDKRDKKTITDAERKELKALEADYGEPFKPTNLTVQAKIKDKTYDFQVLQAYEPAYDKAGNKMDGRGTVVYALKNDALFSNTGNIATYESMSKSSLELLTPFNEAVGKLVPYLERQKPLPAKKNGEVDLETFNKDNDGGKLGFMIGNDWLTGPSLYQDQTLNQRKDIHKIFFMHNSYDSGAITAKEAAYDRGWPIPKELTKPDDLYSQLTLSLKSADAVVANKNFVKTLTQTDFGKGQKFVAALRHHLENGTIFDMHHGLDEAFRPDDNEFLRANFADEYRNEKDDKEVKQRKQIDYLTNTQGETQKYQFKQLDKAALLPETSATDKEKAWKEFKAENKKALQQKYGLEQDPNAIVMNWAARLEPNQKGFYLLQHTLEKVLEDAKKQGKNVQILIAGNVGGDGPNEQKIVNWINAINQKYAKEPGKNQVYIPNAFVSKREITQMNAGSDFTILPSLYEPYGLTQLEAIMMGSIPLVNGVDGLRTTVSDPIIRLLEKCFDFIGAGDDVKEKVWNYDQTGVMLGNINAPEYRAAIMREQFFVNLRYKVENADYGKFLYSESTKEDFKNLRETLEESQSRISNESQKKEIARLLARLNKPEPKLTKKDLDVLTYIEEQDKDCIKNAQDKFAAAMERAINLHGEKEKDKDEKLTGRDLISVVRENGFRFLKEHHVWDEIISSRYYPLLDHSFSAHPGQQLGKRLEFTKTPPFPPENETRKNGTPPPEPTGFLNKTWANFKAAVATIVYYINVFNWFKKAGVKQSGKDEAAASE